MPGRGDLMSLSTIQKKDGMKTTTTKFCTGRALSNNMRTDDITGKFQQMNLIILIL